MIRASMTRDDRLFRLEVEGHAGMAARGQDIVCAAASVLCFALEAALTKDLELGRSDSVPEVEICEGYFCIEVDTGGVTPEEVLAVLSHYRSAWAGMRLLAHQYPRSVRCESMGPDVFE